MFLDSMNDRSHDTDTIGHASGLVAQLRIFTMKSDVLINKHMFSRLRRRVSRSLPFNPWDNDVRWSTGESHRHC